MRGRQVRLVCSLPACLPPLRRCKHQQPVGCAVCQRALRLCLTVCPERRRDAACQLARAVLAPAGFRWYCKHSGKGERARQRATRPSQRMCTATKTKSARGLMHSSLANSRAGQHHAVQKSSSPSYSVNATRGAGVASLHAIHERERRRDSVRRRVEASRAINI